MNNSEETKAQEITEPASEKAEEEKIEVTEQPAVTETVSEAPLSVEDIVSGKKGTSPGVQKRIDELTREKYEARREADFWKSEAEKAKRVPQEVGASRPIPPLEKDFADPEDYRKAYVTYEDNLETWRGNYRKEETLRADMEREFRENAAKFDQSASRMRAVYPDFDESVNNPIFSMNLVGEIHASDLGPEIGYYLSKNPAEAARIGAMTPQKIAKEIGKLEVKFSEAIKKKPTSAPTPLNTVKGEDVVKKDESKMTDDEWNQYWRQEQLKKMKLVK